MASTDTVKLSVTVLGGDTIKLDVNPGETIDNIKALIEKMQGTPAHQQKLTFRGKALQEGSLSENNIKKKAVLLLIKNPSAENPNPPKGESVLCRTGCGFFGSTATDSMCSKCFEKNLESGAAKNDKEEEKQTPTASSSSPKDIVMGEAADDLAGGLPRLDDMPAITNSPPAQPHPTRCYKCNRRVGFTIIKCRCGFGFCGKHRYSDQHDCPYDYKASQQAILSKANQKVQADKLKNRLV